MKFFPVAAGMVSILLCIVLIVLTVVFAKRNRAASIASGVVAGICAVYLIIGCCVLFPSSWRKDGNAYFSAGVQKSDVGAALTNATEKEKPLADFVPGAETYQTEQIVYKNGINVILERQSALYPDTDSRAEILLYTFDSEELAKSAFAEEQKEMNAQFDASDKSLQIDGEGYTVYISPIAYDGTRFLLPAADISGASFQVIIQCKNQCICIREQSAGQSLTLPDTLFAEE